LVLVPAVVYYADSALVGGAEQSLLNLLQGIDRRYWRPQLICHPELAQGRFLAALRALDVPVSVVPRPSGPGSLAVLGRFAATLKRMAPDLFHANLPSPLSGAHGLAAACLAGVPCLATEQLSAPITLSRWALQQRILAYRVDRYIAVSHELALFLQRTLRFPADRIRVVHNGILLAPYEHQVQHTAGNTFIVLTVARLDAQKGHRYLLEAAAQLPGVSFVMAGAGPEEESLQRQAAEFGVADRVSFLGHRDDVPVLLAGCDLFVLPSLFEGLPLAILEAMAAGKPVISSAVGGAPEVIVEGETGLLVPPADAATLAAGIRSLAADPNRRRRMGAAGRARVREMFSAETMVRKTVAVYNELLRASP
jgi:glycosyltransferase involved in cell wall biosynthesis